MFDRRRQYLGHSVQILGVEADAEVALPILQLTMRGSTCLPRRRAVVDACSRPPHAYGLLRTFADLAGLRRLWDITSA